MPAFKADEKHSWYSLPTAMGPFIGLHGGALAGLMTFELENMAMEENLGHAVSASIDFLRPTRPGTFVTNPQTISVGRRVSILSNRILQGNKCTAEAKVCFIKPGDLTAVNAPRHIVDHPENLAVEPSPRAPHGGPWMMDHFEVRRSPSGVTWFRFVDNIVENVTPLARVLGPADWTHGLDRPRAPKLADPNVNLKVVLARHPTSTWIGIQPETTWMPTGIGMGSGILSDLSGPFGHAMMTVALSKPT